MLMPSYHDRFILRFGKNAERVGLTDDFGGVCRELFVQHSANPQEPFWTVAEDQSAPSKSPYRDKVVALAAEDPDLSYQSIADRIGCSKAVVHKYYPREDAE